MFRFLMFVLCCGAAVSCMADLKKCELRFFQHEVNKKINVLPPDSQVIRSAAALEGKLGSTILNLDPLCGGKNSAVAVIELESPTERSTWFGVGCRIFSVSVNGKTVYDLLWKGLGNDYDPVSVRDHIFPVKLKAGKNIVVIQTHRTNYLQDYCYGKNRKINWHLTFAELPDYRPVKAELAHPEFLSRPDRGEVMFTFITVKPVPAGIDYRIKGSKKWQRKWDLAGELVMREKSRVHRIRLEDLEDDAEYEYRIVLLEPPAGTDGLRRPMWTVRQYKEVFMPIGTFKTFGKENKYSFIVFGDTQLSLSQSCCTVESRSRYLEKLRSFPEYKNADFVVHIGDMDSYFHDIEKHLFTDLLDDFNKGADRKQFVCVRGNHEVNGIDAEKWYDYFMMPDEKPFYTFRRGDVLFIVLDCGDAGTNDMAAGSGPLMDLPNLFAKQSEWLEKLKKTDEFRNARFRVVLSHVEPQISSDHMSEKVRKMVMPLLKDDSEDGMIHLWIGGHVHYYWRINRNSDILRGNVKAKKYALKKAPVTWLTLDGPKGANIMPDFSYLQVNVDGDKLDLTVIDQDGKKIDQFSVDKKGRVKELMKEEKLKTFKLK